MEKKKRIPMWLEIIVSITIGGATSGILNTGFTELLWWVIVIPTILGWTMLVSYINERD